jgi:hypothetical protein
MRSVTALMAVSAILVTAGGPVACGSSHSSSGGPADTGAGKDASNRPDAASRADGSTARGDASVDARPRDAHAEADGPVERDAGRDAADAHSTSADAGIDANHARDAGDEAAHDAAHDSGHCTPLGDRTFSCGASPCDRSTQYCIFGAVPNTCHPLPPECQCAETFNCGCVMSNLTCNDGGLPARCVPYGDGGEVQAADAAIVGYFWIEAHSCSVN